MPESLRVPYSLHNPCLAVLTDRTLLPPTWTLGQALAPAVTGGVDLVILQEYDLPKVPRKTVAEFVADGIRGRAAYVIAEGVDLAEAIGATGVHLHGDIQLVQQARERLGEDALIGYTAKSLDEISTAKEYGADYVLVCLDWSDANSALATLKRYATESLIPVLAGADVPMNQAANCLLAGAEGITIISTAMDSPDRAGKMQEYKQALGGPNDS
ncbi:MAG: thiamine phosphate synthase [Chthonomonadales bacterium]